MYFYFIKECVNRGDTRREFTRYKNRQDVFRETEKNTKYLINLGWNVAKILKR